MQPLETTLLPAKSPGKSADDQVKQPQPAEGAQHGAKNGFCGVYDMQPSTRRHVADPETRPDPIFASADSQDTAADVVEEVKPTAKGSSAQGAEDVVAQNEGAPLDAQDVKISPVPRTDQRAQSDVPTSSVRPAPSVNAGSAAPVAQSPTSTHHAQPVLGEGQAASHHIPTQAHSGSGHSIEASSRAEATPSPRHVPSNTEVVLTLGGTRNGHVETRPRVLHAGHDQPNAFSGAERASDVGARVSDVGAGTARAATIAGPTITGPQIPVEAATTAQTVEPQRGTSNEARPQTDPASLQPAVRQTIAKIDTPARAEQPAAKLWVPTSTRPTAPDTRPNTPDVNPSIAAQAQPVPTRTQATDVMGRPMVVERPEVAADGPAVRVDSLKSDVPQGRDGFTAPPGQPPVLASRTAPVAGQSQASESPVRDFDVDDLPPLPKAPEASQRPTVANHPLQTALFSQMQSLSNARFSRSLIGGQTEEALKAEADIAELAALEAKGVSTGRTGNATAVRFDGAVAVVRQVGEALRVAPKGERSIEVSLNPAELGKLRMTLSPTETSVAVSIVAERGETLDLMRRNIDDLAKSFEDMGYENVSFDFEQREGFGDTDRERSEQQAQSGSSGEDAPVETAVAAPLPTPQLRMSDSGVDVRL